MSQVLAWPLKRPRGGPRAAEVVHITRKRRSRDAATSRDKMPPGWAASSFLGCGQAEKSRRCPNYEEQSKTGIKPGRVRGSIGNLRETRPSSAREQRAQEIPPGRITRVRPRILVSRRPPRAEHGIFPALVNFDSFCRDSAMQSCTLMAIIKTTKAILISDTAAWMECGLGNPISLPLATRSQHPTCLHRAASDSGIEQASRQR